MANAQNPRYNYGRMDNKDLYKIYTQDSENPIQFHPDLETDNKFFKETAKKFFMR